MSWPRFAFGWVVLALLMAASVADLCGCRTVETQRSRDHLECVYELRHNQGLALDVAESRCR